MLIYYNIMVKYGTRPVRDVVIMQYDCKPGTCPVRDVDICSILVQYGTPPDRDVDILQYYDEIWHPSSRGCCYIAAL